MTIQIAHKTGLGQQSARTMTMMYFMYYIPYISKVMPDAGFIFIFLFIIVVMIP